MIRLTLLKQQIKSNQFVLVLLQFFSLLLILLRALGRVLESELCTDTSNTDRRNFRDYCLSFNSHILRTEITEFFIIFYQWNSGVVAKRWNRWLRGNSLILKNRFLYTTTHPLQRTFKESKPWHFHLGKTKRLEWINDPLKYLNY